MANQSADYDCRAENRKKNLTILYIGDNDIYIPMQESPTDYYARTIHTGNIGTLTLNEASNYVDRMLLLPTLDESLDS